ncbi:MAG: hypothetical protein K2I73_06805 [Eubacterium sp.]|nr:hypothetical protein [Eubacterium sp.]
MNNEIYLRLERLMKRLGFSVSDSSYTKAEMKAYAAAVSLAEEKMKSILKNTFITTADHLGLSMFLSMIGETPASADSKSKENVISAVSDQRGFYTKAYFDKIVQSLGTGSSYTVNGNVMDLKYAGNTYRPTLDDYSKLITDYNPCTVLVDNNSGRAFSKWDYAAFRWFEIDKRNIPFSTLDTIK